MIGTARYSSISTHLGIEQSRRDDLECLGYGLLYLARGSLPWQGLKIDNKKEKYEKILEMKSSISVDSLCKDLPIEFARYMYYCKELKFDDKPDYEQLRGQFKDSFQRLKGEKPFFFDWNSLKTEIKASIEKSEHSSDSHRAVNWQPESPVQNSRSTPNKGKESRLAEIQKLISGLPPCLRPKNLDKFEECIKAVPIKDAATNEAETPATVGDVKQPSSEDSGKVKAEEAEVLGKEGEKQEQSGDGQKDEEESKEEARELEEKIDLAKMINEIQQKVALFKQITKEYSDRSSCNFNILEIIENYTLFGKLEVCYVYRRHNSTGNASPCRVEGSYVHIYKQFTALFQAQV